MAMTAAIVAMATTAAAAVMSGLGSIASGYSQKTQADFQATMAEKQGELANLQARSQAADIQSEAQRLRAQQIAQGAAAGVDISDSGSLWDVITQSQKTAEEERQTVLRTGMLNKEAYGVEAQNYRTTGKMAKRAGYISGFSSLLTGVAQGINIADRAGMFQSSTASSASSTAGKSQMMQTLENASKWSGSSQGVITKAYSVFQ